MSASSPILSATTARRTFDRSATDPTWTDAGTDPARGPVAAETGGS